MYEFRSIDLNSSHIRKYFPSVQYLKMLDINHMVVISFVKTFALRNSGEAIFFVYLAKEILKRDKITSHDLYKQRHCSKACIKVHL